MNMAIVGSTRPLVLFRPKHYKVPILSPLALMLSTFRGQDSYPMYPILQQKRDAILFILTTYLTGPHIMPYKIPSCPNLPPGPNLMM